MSGSNFGFYDNSAIIILIITEVHLVDEGINVLNEYGLLFIGVVGMTILKVKSVGQVNTTTVSGKLVFGSFISQYYEDCHVLYSFNFSTLF